MAAPASCQAGTGAPVLCSRITGMRDMAVSAAAVTSPAAIENFIDGAVANGVEGQLEIVAIALDGHGL